MKIINYRIQIPLSQNQYFDLLKADTGDFKPTIKSLGATDLSFDIFGGICFNTTCLNNATRIENYVMTVLNSFNTWNS